MMHSSRGSVMVLGLFISGYTSASQNCKCIPSSSCWPSPSTWESLSLTLSSPSALIHNVPLAISCYPGPLFSRSECAIIDDQFTNSTFLAALPLGYDYSRDNACPPLNLTNSSTSEEDGSIAGSSGCTIGNEPVMTVNATTVEDVSKAVQFAAKWNIRVAIKNTGHDILGRSTGFGSLEIWIHYLKLGIIFEESYSAPPSCASNWTGHAYTIRGGYDWRDLYADAAERGVIIVGGSEPTVGCLGGWMQGGGHSEATRNYGLGADQVLAAKVVLANGILVTVSACENSDLFFAIRGGGGGTYGIVVEETVKAYPTVPITTQSLAIAPLSASGLPDFMSALAIIYSSLPELNDQGISGYGIWSIASPTPIFATFSTGYAHAFNLFNSSIAVAEEIFAPLLADLEAFNSTLIISSTFATVPTYAASQETSNTPVGNANGAIGSRLLSREALTGNLTALKEMLNIIAGTPDQQASSNVCLVGGGQVFADVADPFSGINPAWRTAYVHNIVNRGWADGTDAKKIQAIKDDITFGKVGAMKKLTPGSGCYMNEADVNDPDYLNDFYGQHASLLGAIKHKYDPNSLFYCPTCIGSEDWEQTSDGALCQI